MVERAIEEPLNEIEFIHIEGDPPKEPLTLFALSTCGFCRRAMNYLKEENLAFRYVYVDLLARTFQVQIRNFVRKTYKTELSFPFLCLGVKDYQAGFLRSVWNKELLDE